MDYLVTSIEEIKHSYTNKKKLVYINYEPAFALYNKELKTYSVKENETISEQDYSNIVQMLSKRATVRAMNLLKSKDYTKKELVSKSELSSLFRLKKLNSKKTLRTILHALPV